MDDSHIPEEVLSRYAIRGIPGDAHDVTNHLIACDRCHAVYQHELNLKSALLRSREPQAPAAPAGHPLRFTFPKSVWAAAAVLLLSVFMIPDGREAAAGVQVLEMKALRGGQPVHARPHVPLVLQLNTAGLDAPPQVRVDVVTERGRTIWQGSARQENGLLRAAAPQGFGPGQYWVRIPDPANPRELLREFRLEVR